MRRRGRMRLERFHPEIPTGPWVVVRQEATETYGDRKVIPEKDLTVDQMVLFRSEEKEKAILYWESTVRNQKGELIWN